MIKIKSSKQSYGRVWFNIGEMFVTLKLSALGQFKIDLALGIGASLARRFSVCGCGGGGGRTIRVPTMPFEFIIKDSLV